jgi:hypothetical protein
LTRHNIPEFDLYYVAYLKDDPAKEPSPQVTAAQEFSPKQHTRLAGPKLILS